MKIVSFLFLAFYSAISLAEKPLFKVKFDDISLSDAWHLIEQSCPDANTEGKPSNPERIVSYHSNEEQCEHLIQLLSKWDLKPNG